ncbi:XylR N-terminal domain-containing protein [Mesobaculum littorinae]|uniref:XylR N-terminal domain-containing protein n=1 Tax=Mesobaculum littorinae TaxID=2486419 RepID=UPI0013E34EE8|nr:XylR N-terminal domain-containing protein [Mesobaculum littorinae]
MRELLSLVDFNPLKGIIELNGARIIMQRANVGHVMRRELRATLGEEETRVFLMRQGYLTGRSDALFVRENWPNLNIGDAFTAGTRLHTFTGTVRVETVHNDFDFKTKRFSGEFIWHDSVEAEQIARDGLRSSAPCCWTLVGYASGYATAFFGKPILYQEKSCIAQGKPHCRVVGKPLEEWKPDDPAVVRFRDRVLAREPSKAAAGDTRSTPSSPSDPIAEPVREALTLRLSAGLPCLLSGPPDSGRRQVLEAAVQTGASTSLVWWDGADLTPEAVQGDAAAGPGPLLIDGPERCRPEVQTLLARGHVPFHGVTTLSADRLRTDWRISSEFLNLMAVGVVAMPAFTQRDASNRIDVVTGLATAVASRISRPIAPDAIATLATAPRVTGLSQITGILRLHALTGCDVETAISTLARPNPDPGTDPRLAAWIDDALAHGTLDLGALERRIRDAALAQESGNLAAAARRLGLTRAQLAYRLKVDTERD